MSCVAVIPVRGGSRRIPRKNLRLFRGQPLLAYPVRACLAAGCFDAVVVTTEDPELAALAADLGALVHVRPSRLADDHTPLTPVALDALAGYPDETEATVVLANPFVRAADLAAGQALTRAVGAPYASVAWLPVPVERVLTFHADGLRFVGGRGAEQTRTQDLALPCYDAGQWYATRAGWLRASGALLAGARPFALPRERVQDIDTEEDWRAAERLHAALEDDR